MRVLVTGGAGFIGARLVEELLKNGDEVLVIDSFATSNRDRLTPVFEEFGPGSCDYVDIADRGGVERWFQGNAMVRPLDCVYHLAARASIVPSVQNPRLYHDVNVTGTLNILEMVRRYAVPRFVYAASGSCYGIPAELPTSEQCPVQPLYPYALTKWMGEQYALHFGRLYGISVMSLRLFNVFGPRMCLSGGYGGVFSIILPQKLNNKPVVLIGDGGQRRDFVYVTDVAQAFLKASGAGLRNEVINIARGQSVSISEILSLVGISDEEVVRMPDRPGEPRLTQADISYAASALHWKPLVSFEDGLREMLKDQSYWRNARVWTYQETVDAQREWYARFGVNLS